MPKNRVDRYLDIQRRTKKVYLRYGCIGYEVFKGDNDYWLEINKFKNREHYENVNKSVDADPEIEILWKEFCSIVKKRKSSYKEIRKKYSDSQVLHELSVVKNVVKDFTREELSVLMIPSPDNSARGHRCHPNLFNPAIPHLPLTSSQSI